jgi:hypothetical protein
MADYRVKTEGMTREQIRVYILDRLQDLRLGWSDEIPREIIHSTSKDTKYKVRGSWFGIVLLRLELLENKGILAKESFDKYSKRYAEIQAQRIARNGLTSRGDIEGINKILDEAIAELKNQTQ